MIMKNNETLQKDVQDALKWEPLLHAAEIGVTVNDGVVTLTGNVDSYTKKLEAENAAKSVAGVKAVAEEITISFNGGAKHTDSQIAAEVVKAFNFNWEVPDDKVHVTVEHGWITLTGEVEWNYQKEAANKAVKNVAGVLGVMNHISIKSNWRDGIEKTAVERALNRNWSIDGDDIIVAVSGSAVTLHGKVGSIYQRDEAGRIAWNTPGVQTVDNELIVDYRHYMAL
jgi:osmotically-inducible protein OsmY